MADLQPPPLHGKLRSGPIKEWKRLLKFGVVGAVNTLWSYLLFAALIYVGVGNAVASLIALVAGIGVGFLTQGSLVFGHLSRGALVRFVLVWAVIYGVYVGVVAATNAAGYTSYVGGAVAIPVVAVLSYLLQSRFVFSRSAQ